MFIKTSLVTKKSFKYIQYYQLCNVQLVVDHTCRSGGMKHFHSFFQGFQLFLHYDKSATGIVSSFFMWSWFHCCFFVEVKNSCTLPMWLNTSRAKHKVATCLHLGNSTFPVGHPHSACSTSNKSLSSSKESLYMRSSHIGGMRFVWMARYQSNHKLDVLDMTALK